MIVKITHVGLFHYRLRERQQAKSQTSHPSYVCCITYYCMRTLLILRGKPCVCMSRRNLINLKLRSNLKFIHTLCCFMLPQGVCWAPRSNGVQEGILCSTLSDKLTFCYECLNIVTCILCCFICGQKTTISHNLVNLTIICTVFTVLLLYSLHFYNIS